MNHLFTQGGRTELRDMLQEQGPSKQQHSAAQLRQQREIYAAAEHILRDSERLDPRWRDPLSPAAERRHAVMVTLTQAITEARRGEAPAAWAALAFVQATDEKTLLELYDSTVGWSTIQTYFDLPDTTEIKFVGAQVQIFSAGQPPVTIDNPLSSTETEQRARILAQDANQPIHAAEPQRSLALGYGTRVTMVLHPRALRPFLTFRRGRTEPWTLDTLIQRGTLNQAIADLLRFLLRSRLSVITVGATGSGKTALLETLLNELAGHIISIEDGAQELLLKPAQLWTPQVVDVVGDHQALTDALIGVLRQTPDAVAVGECRGTEAGAILSLATSDHQMFFTIHAEDSRGALRRFASRATMRGADYEGRFEDALTDTVHSLPIVAVQQYWGQVGRRLVTELAVAVGVERDAIGVLQPVVKPLAEAYVNAATGAIDWHVYAQPNAAGDGIEFKDGFELPATLQRKIQMGVHRAWSAGHTGQTSFARFEAALQRAQTSFQAQRYTQALAEIRNAWTIRHDSERVLPLLQHIYDHQPHLCIPAHENYEQLRAALQTALQQRSWQQVDMLYTQCQHDPLWLLYAPGMPWKTVQSQIIEGIEQWRLFDALIHTIDSRIAAHAARETLDELDQLPVHALDTPRLHQRLQARVTLLQHLVQQQQVAPETLTSAQSQLAAALQQRSLHHDS